MIALSDFNWIAKNSHLGMVIPNLPLEDSRVLDKLIPKKKLNEGEREIEFDKYGLMVYRPELRLIDLEIFFEIVKNAEKNRVKPVYGRLGKKLSGQLLDFYKWCKSARPSPLRLRQMKKTFGAIPRNALMNRFSRKNHKRK